jgi:hypothetical protein
MEDPAVEKVETSADEPPEIGPDVPERQTPVRQSRRLRRTWILLSLLLLLCVGFFFFFGHGRAERSAKPVGPPAPPAVSIETTTARKGSIGVYVNALGTVTPLSTVTIKTHDFSRALFDRLFCLRLLKHAKNWTCLTRSI